MILTREQMKDQAKRCPCGGADDYCPCQNVEQTHFSPGQAWGRHYSEDDVDRCARALAKCWGENWECVCQEQMGMSCDCGDALSEARVDRWDDRMSRQDYRDAARTILEAFVEASS